MAVGVMAVALMASLLAGAVAGEPIGVVNGTATIRALDLVEDPDTGLLEAAVVFPERPSARRLLNAKPDDSPAGRLLAQLLRQGAAGNHGDLYDNRDRGHSRLRPDDHPRLTFTAYDEAARETGLDYGLNLRLKFDTITIGNSSTAVTGGPLWRSLPRLALARPDGPTALAALYAANHLYVYPSHQDYRASREGDAFPAQTPYMVISLGSSGSDRPFLRALADTLAAFRPETKALLRARGLVAPTLQMLLRRSLAGVESDADYLSARAHPTVFDGATLRPDAMMRRAHGLNPDEVPPAVRLTVLEEPEPSMGVGLFGEGLSERLFDTPGAVARIARGVPGIRRYRLSVAETRDPNGRDLSFHWRLLRGRAAIRPIEEDGSVAEVVVPWTEPYSLDGVEGLETFRTDIAVFADNGATLSAPAFFSVAFPPTERRRYGADGRPLEIDYDPPEARDRYADPLLFARRPWRDVYAYTEDGALLGWQRFRRDGSEDHYTRHGLRVIERDALGRPARARLVGYVPERGPRGRARIAEVETDTFGQYRYTGPDDQLGEPAPLGAPVQE